MTCICWVQSPNHAQEMSFSSRVHVSLSCMSFPGPPWPRRQMLILILDLVQVTKLRVIFRDVSKVWKQEVKAPEIQDRTDKTGELKDVWPAGLPERRQRGRRACPLCRLLHTLSGYITVCCWVSVRLYANWYVFIPSSFITFRSCAYLDKKHTVFGR